MGEKDKDTREGQQASRQAGIKKKVRACASSANNRPTHGSRDKHDKQVGSVEADRTRTCDIEQAGGFMDGQRGFRFRFPRNFLFHHRVVRLILCRRTKVVKTMDRQEKEKDKEKAEETEDIEENYRERSKKYIKESKREGGGSRGDG